VIRFVRPTNTATSEAWTRTRRGDEGGIDQTALGQSITGTISIVGDRRRFGLADLDRVLGFNHGNGGEGARATTINLNLDQTGNRCDSHRSEDHRERHVGAYLWGPFDRLPAVQEGDLVLVHGVEDELHTDKRQDESDSVLEVDEFVDQIAEQEVQLAQAHKSENVRGEHDERVLRDSEDRGDRVQSKHEVCHTDGNEHHENRGERLATVNNGAQFSTVVVFGDADATTEQPNDGTLLLLHLVLGLGGLLDRSEKQECTEEVEDRREVLDQLSADQNKDSTKDQRDDDSHHQHFLLILTGHRESRHDDDENEQVVNAQAVFGHPPSDELASVFGATENEHEQSEDESQSDVKAHPQCGLTGRRDVRPFVGQGEICGENQQQYDERANFKPGGQGEFHGVLLRIVGRGSGDGKARKSLPHSLFCSPLAQATLFRLLSAAVSGATQLGLVLTNMANWDTPLHFFSLAGQIRA